nr:ead/Ea22-like family protein [Escherichia coli]
MSKIDYQALREKAEKATKGSYIVGHTSVNQHGNLTGVFVCQKWKGEPGGVIAECHVNCLIESDAQAYANAEFIAEANPATVLALLDERERNQQYIKRRDQKNEDIALTVEKLRVELEAVQKTSAARIEANCATQWLTSTTQSEWMAAIRHWQQSLTLLNAHMKNQQAQLAFASKESDMALTHRELCQIAYKFLKRNGFKVCFHDRFIAVTSTGEQPDAMGFRNSASCLIEAKCSRADLLADRKKRFRKNPSLGMGDWRFFISEPGIISIEDLPPGWGLLHVVNGRVRKVHGWPKGNCCWGNPDDKPFTGNKQVECDYMLSALRRMELRGHLNEIYDGVIVNKKEGNAA